MLTKLFVCTLTIFVVISVTPTLGASRFRRQAVAVPANLEDVLAALNLTNYLQSATPQIQQAIANLTIAIQNQSQTTSINFQQALENVSLQGQNLVQGLQTFFTNLQNQLANQMEAKAQELSNAITILQNFYNTIGVGASLQNLVNTLGSTNLTTAASNFQNQLTNLTQFLQTGLNQMYNSSAPAVQQSIQNLRTALNNGTLNQALATLVTNFQGQIQTFQTVLNNLQLLVGSTNNALQLAIITVANGFQTYLNYLQTQVQNLLNTFGGFLTGTATITTSAALTIVVG